MTPQQTSGAQTVETTVPETWHAPLNKVTALSKVLATIVFITLPFVGFWLGMKYAGGGVSALFMPEGAYSLQVADVAQKVVVEQVSFDIAKADPTSADESDSQKYQQAILAYVYFSDGNIERYSLGDAYGCVAASSTVSSSDENKTVLGKVDCYFSLTGVNFVAYLQNDKFIIERNEESAKDGSVDTTTLVEM